MGAAGIILADGKLGEIDELIRHRTVASVPFGGRYRLVDFALSNFVNADITQVGIITKRNYQSLMDHIGSGKDWDLSRKNGGVIIFPPYGNPFAKCLKLKSLDLNSLNNQFIFEDRDDTTIPFIKIYYNNYCKQKSCKWKETKL